MTTSTTVSETIRGSWRYGSHARLLTRELSALRTRGEFQATTYIFKGEGGYENEVPQCQSATKSGDQCSRAGIVNVSGGWHTVVDALGFAICAQHAKAAALTPATGTEKTYVVTEAQLFYIQQGLLAGITACDPGAARKRGELAAKVHEGLDAIRELRGEK